MIGRILVGLGGLDTNNAGYTESATRLAIDLAKRHNAALTGVTVVNRQHLQKVGPVPLGAGAAAAELREHRLAESRDHIEAAVVHFCERCDAAGVTTRVLREERGEPFDYLISEARYHDLTVLGLRGLFEYGVHGEAHYDPVTSLVRLVEGGVRPLVASGPQPRVVEKVFVAYSGSNESAKSMRRFVQLRLWPDARIRVATFDADHNRGQRRLLHAANYFADHGIEVERDYRAVDPSVGVLDAAHEWGADLVVMGNSNRTLLSRRVLGDTMLSTVRDSDLPVFLAQ